MLIFPLKKEWYEKIKSGEKTVEYREAKNYWSARISTYLAQSLQSRKCYFQLGYRPETRLAAVITNWKIIDGKNTDLHIDKPVFAISFELE